MKNTTAVLFLILACIVAIFNILIARYELVVFVAPFLVCCLLPRKAAKVLETFTLAAIGVYVLVWQSEYTGMVILYASAIWFFVYLYRDIRAELYLILMTIFITIASYYTAKEYATNLAIHAIMDGLFFGIGSFATLVTIKNLGASLKIEARPIGAKYFALLDTLSKTMHEMMDTIKSLQEGDSNDRSRKDN